jgi:hypothetical protein
VFGRQHHQAGILVIRNVRSTPRKGVDAGEVTGLTRILANAIVELGVDFVRLPFQLLGSIVS